MKTKNLFLVFTMAFTFILTSCSIENRLYMSGYHVEWKNWKQNPNKQELVSNDEEKLSVIDQTEEPALLEADVNHIENTAVASTDNSIIIATPKIRSLIKKEKLLVGKSNTVIEHKVFTQRKINKVQKFKKAKSPDDTSYGFLYMLLLVFLFVCIIVYVLEIISGVSHIARLFRAF